MTNTSPAEIFKGTFWKPITDRFLYCVDGSVDENGNPKMTSKDTGGFNKIGIEHLPEHKHTMDVYKVRITEGNDSAYDVLSAEYDQDNILKFNTNKTGDGEEFLPPYITVYA